MQDVNQYALQIDFQNSNTGRVVWIRNFVQSFPYYFLWSVYNSTIDSIINILEVITYQNILQFIISMPTYIQKDNMN